MSKQEREKWQNLMMFIESSKAGIQDAYDDGDKEEAQRLEDELWRFIGRFKLVRKPAKPVLFGNRLK